MSARLYKQVSLDGNWQLATGGSDTKNNGNTTRTSQKPAVAGVPIAKSGAKRNVPTVKVKES